MQAARYWPFRELPEHWLEWVQLSCGHHDCISWLSVISRRKQRWGGESKTDFSPKIHSTYVIRLAPSDCLRIRQTVAQWIKENSVAGSQCGPCSLFTFYPLASIMQRILKERRTTRLQLTIDVIDIISSIYLSRDWSSKVRNWFVTLRMQINN